MNLNVGDKFYSESGMNEHRAVRVATISKTGLEGEYGPRVAFTLVGSPTEIISTLELDPGYKGRVVKIGDFVRHAGHKWFVTNVTGYPPSTFELRRTIIVDPKRRYLDEAVTRRNVPAIDCEPWTEDS